MRKTRLRMISILSALVILFASVAPITSRAASIISDETILHMDDFIIENVADITNLSEAIHPEGQNYGWSTTENGDYIYVGTGYNIIGSAGSQIINMILANIPGIDPEEAEEINNNFWKLIFNGQLPDQRVNGHAILLKIHKETNEVELITPEYDESQVTGYRNALVYHDTIYFVAVSPQGGLVKVDPETNTSSIVYQPEDGAPGAYRGLYVYDGELLFSYGTLTGAELQASSTPEDPDSWVTIADESEFNYYPASGTFGAASGGGIWEMVEYNGTLYVSIATSNDEDGNARGFSLFKAEKDGSDWNWIEVIGDTDLGAKYPFGLGRTTPVTLTSFVYDGYLYLGEFNNTPLNLIMAAAGNLEPLYHAMNQPVNLYRMDANENIELVIGDPMEGIPGPIGNMGSGFDDNNIQYIWWMEEYDEKLFVGTFDISTILDVLNFSDMTKEELMQKIHYLIELIVSILQALGDEIFGEIEGLPAVKTSSLLKNANVDRAALKDYFPHFSASDLKAMLGQLVQLSEEVKSGEGTDVAATYEKLQKLYEEKIKPVLTNHDIVFEPSLLPTIEDILALFELFFGPDITQQFIYYLAINEYTKQATMGFDVFYSEDGVNFNVLTRDGFGHPESYGLRTFLNTSHGLYLTTSGPYNGFEVWRLQAPSDPLELESYEDTLTSRFDLTATFKLTGSDEVALMSVGTSGDAIYTVYADEDLTELAKASATVEDGELVLTLDDGIESSTNFYVTVTETGKYESDAVEVTVHPYVLKDDATLSSLRYSVDGGDEIAVPDFTPDQFDYKVTLPVSTSKEAGIALFGETADSTATITSNEGVTLVNGKGTAEIEVTAEDGTVLTYSVTFTVAEENTDPGNTDHPGDTDPRKELPNTGGVLDSAIYSLMIGVMCLIAGGVMFVTRRRLN